MAPGLSCEAGQGRWANADQDAWPVGAPRCHEDEKRGNGCRDSSRIRPQLRAVCALPHI